ncbi:MAG: hypothetical protein AAB209_10850, partial [Bacteroidota bacterium]
MVRRNTKKQLNSIAVQRNRLMPMMCLGESSMTDSSLWDKHKFLVTDVTHASFSTTYSPLCVGMKRWREG